MRHASIQFICLDASSIHFWKVSCSLCHCHFTSSVRKWVPSTAFAPFFPRWCESLKAMEKNPLSLSTWFWKQTDGCKKLKSASMPSFQYTHRTEGFSYRLNLIKKYEPYGWYKVLILCFSSDSSLTPPNPFFIIQKQDFDKFKYLHCISVKRFWCTSVYSLLTWLTFTIITSEFRLLFNYSKGYQKC